MLELAIVIPILLLIALGAVDFGRAYYTGITVASAARTGAQFGAQDVLSSANDAGMIDAARNDADDQTLTVTPSHFCKCPDGTDIACDGNCAGYGDPQLFVKVVAVDTVNFVLRIPRMRGSLVFRDSATIRAR